MDESISRRCVAIARYMLEHRATVRQAAKIFGLSKSAVHKDMIRRLPGINAHLAREVASLLEYNKSVRHLRGGEATRLRYHPESRPANI
ncbi:MAG: sporulation transcriptional regulator SpoIIID [Clostridia bacterium]|nr:sporulation transcriptional regulator SpoIIID [Clostridia bacterium]